MIKKWFYSAICVVLFFFIVVTIPVVPSNLREASSHPMSTDGWYYLPTYPNYAPQGLPDFDQKQDNWKARQGIWRLIGGLWSFCAPTSLADIFWWFDSKHEAAEGYPGDGVDSYPLVSVYETMSDPLPGPNFDDHNFNAVNDNQTPWRHGKGAKELIESIAWYCNTNFCRYPFVRGSAGTFAKYLEEGARTWIQDAGLQDHYTVEGIWKPDFSLLVDKLHNNSGIIINLLLYRPHALLIQTFLGHYVAITGINPDGSIALSDPFQNEANPGPAPQDHNDAAIVSYDIYPVNFTSPVLEKSSWWIPNYFDFGITRLGGIPQYAMIISEVE
jgi:hypothetical protein